MSICRERGEKEMVKRIGEREEIKSKVLKHREGKLADPHKERQRNITGAWGLGSGRRGRGSPRRVSSPNNWPGSCPGRWAGKGKGGRESPRLLGRAEAMEPASLSSQAISLLPLPFSPSPGLIDGPAASLGLGGFE